MIRQGKPALADHCVFVTAAAVSPQGLTALCTVAPEHDPEKCEAVFRKIMLKTKS
jgi:hypothetical protein